MYLVKPTLKALLLFMVLSIISCSQNTEKPANISSETLEKIKNHFSNGSKKPLKLKVSDGSLAPLTDAEIDKIRIEKTMYYFICGSYFFNNENIATGLAECARLAPASDVTFGVALLA